MENTTDTMAKDRGDLAFASLVKNMGRRCRFGPPLDNTSDNNNNGLWRRFQKKHTAVTEKHLKCSDFRGRATSPALVRASDVRPPASINNFAADAP
jgi:hypothetical protein